MAKLVVARSVLRDAATMRTLARLIVVALVSMIGVVVGGREARACGRGGGYGMEGLAYVAVAAGVVVGGVGITDTVFTVYDATHAAKSNPPSDTWSKAEIYVATPQVFIGGLITATMVSHSSSSIPVVVAWSTWPIALTAHGFYSHNASPYGDGWQTPLAVLSVIDGGLAIYDVGYALTGERTPDGYATGEFFGAFPQTIFGLGFAAATGGPEGRMALLATALPAAMTVHAIVDMATPKERYVPPPPEPIDSHGPLHSVSPSFLVQGARGPVPGLSLSGTF